MSIADQISDLSDEDQQRYFEYVQRRCRQIRQEQIRNRIEREHDDKDRRRPQ